MADSTASGIRRLLTHDGDRLHERGGGRRYLDARLRHELFHERGDPIAPTHRDDLFRKRLATILERHLTRRRATEQPNDVPTEFRFDEPAHRTGGRDAVRGGREDGIHPAAAGDAT